MTRLGARDVRITTRAQLADPTDALYSTLHEVGHALYEQGSRRTCWIRRWAAG